MNEKCEFLLAKLRMGFCFVVSGRRLLFLFPTHSRAFPVAFVDEFISFSRRFGRGKINFLRLLLLINSGLPKHQVMSVQLF